MKNTTSTAETHNAKGIRSKRMLSKKMLSVIGLITITLFAYANDGLEFAEKSLTSTLAHWNTLVPDSFNEGALSDTDFRRLKKQQDLNKETSDAIQAHRNQIDRNSFETFSDIKLVTDSTLKENNWPGGIAAVKQSNPALQASINRTISRLNNTSGRRINNVSYPIDSTLDNSSPALDENTYTDDRLYSARSGSATEPDDSPSDDSSAYGPQNSEDINTRLDQLAAELIDIEKKQLRIYTFQREYGIRAEFDSRFIQRILPLASYQNDLNTFTKRLEKAASLPKTERFAVLYRELLMLHIYLRPQHGFRLIHLGLHHTPDIDYVSTEGVDRRYENHANLELPLADWNAAEPHITNLGAHLQTHGSLEELIKVLTKISTNNAETMVTLDNSAKTVQTAVVLTAVLFDLYQHNTLQGTLKPIAKPLTNVGYLWEFRTCFKERSRGIDQTENCTKAIQPKGLNEPFNQRVKQTIAQPMQNDVRSMSEHNIFIIHQWAYAAAAIRLMTGRTPVSWKTVAKKSY